MKKIIFLLIVLFPLSIKAIETSATSGILMDTDSNRILYSKNINKQRSVASISKIMTAIIAIESNKLDDMVIIGDEIEKAYGSGIYIKKGEKISLRDLIYGLMLRSGNDAALAIANYVGGSVDKFVSMMNDKAKQLKMKNTIFNNPSGLDEDKGNYSTAYDMAILSSYAIQNDEFKKIVGTKNYSLDTSSNVYKWKNKNKLLFSYKYCTGGKTGYTEIAKRTLVTFATKDDVNLVVVTLNDGNDWFDHEALFEYGFSNYSKYRILSKGNINIYDEKYYKNYNLYIKNDFEYLLLSEETNSVLLKYNLEKYKKVKKNMKIGYVDVFIGDKKVHTENIFLSKKKNVKKSFIDKIKELIK